MSRWAGPGSCSAWNAHGWPGTTPTGPPPRPRGPSKNRRLGKQAGRMTPATINDRLLLGLKGTMSEAELYFIRARLQGGLLAKAARGELALRLPIGLVYDGASNVVLDPDSGVRAAIG